MTDPTSRSSHHTTRWIRGAWAVLWLAVAPPLLAQDDLSGLFAEFNLEGLSVDEKPLGLEGPTRAEGRATWIEPRSRWTGSFARTDFTLTFSIAPDGRAMADIEPDYLLNQLADVRETPAVVLGPRQWFGGSFGYLPYACAEVLQVPRDEEDPATRICWAGRFEDSSYLLDAVFDGTLSQKQTERFLRDLAKSLSFEGDTANTRWTDEEAKARWESVTPTDLHDQLEVRRTEHYIILSNAGSDLFASKMEECYDTIQATYPFPEVPGRRLMPVFVFRTAQQYYDYYVRLAEISLGQAKKSKGHAWRDYYATWYESPNDPVHIHEATHQIFSNRLKLQGGGSWFQEGVAEYLSENRNETKSVARRLIRSEEFVPFQRFMILPSLIDSTSVAARRGGSSASIAYAQAASIIFFLKDSRFGRDKFDEFLHTMGRVFRGDLEGIEHAFQTVYGVGIDGIEAESKRYWTR